MDPAIDPFQPLLRLMDRYRQDVHALRPPAPEEALRQVEQDLGVGLPAGFAEFLLRWNGANLFRGALRIRSLAELVGADPAHPELVLFADGPRADEQWAFVESRPGVHLLGTWGAGGFRPVFYKFHRWLTAILTLTDDHVRSEAERLDTMLLCDPRNAILLATKAERFIAEGDPDRALPLLRQATVEDPDLLPAWQRLGDVLIAQDPAEARFAYLRAFRAMRLPRPYPGFLGADADLVASLRGLFEPGDVAWERELANFLTERLTDVRDGDEAAFAECAGLALARLFLARGERKEAREAGRALLERSRAFLHPSGFERLALQLVRLETDLGLHDEAEGHLLPLLEGADLEVRALALLALGRIVVSRQEPWAEEILEEALWAFQALERQRGPVNEHIAALLLLAERHLLSNRLDVARDALGRAEVLIRRVGVPSWRAWYGLLLGDLQRVSGQREQASRSYTEAERLAVDQGDLELRYRVAARAGQLALAEGQEEEARAAFTEAALGFRKLDLPIREGWALLRLGQLGDEEALAKARERFERSDLAIGIAAVNEASGVPPKLDEILKRAAEYARQRAEALRLRAPRTRAEADRPERRLGGHEISIAACDKRIVKALESEARTQARALEGSSCAPTDPKLASYQAALNLLAHHPSWDAADALLKHLSECYISGPPGRLVQAALCRTPNFGLVDGLIDMLSTGQDPVTRARCAEVLGRRKVVQAAAALRGLVGEGHPHRLRRSAIRALGRLGIEEAIEEITPALDDPETAEAAAIALLLLGDRRGVAFHAQLLVDAEESRGGFPGEIVGRYGDPSYLLLLIATARREGEASLGAMQGLGYLGDMRAVPHLIEILGRHDPRAVEVAAGALEILTGHRVPIYEPGLKTGWTRFWEQAESRFAAGLRYRFGCLLDPGFLIEKLGDDDANVRGAAYDELVITSGQRLPFDVEGPWRVQVHHRAHWTRWWSSARVDFPSGRWTFHGQVTG